MIIINAGSGRNAIDGIVVGGPSDQFFHEAGRSAVVADDLFQRCCYTSHLGTCGAADAVLQVKRALTVERISLVALRR